MGGNREDKGVSPMILGSTVDLDRESVHYLFIGKAESKTSHC
jgi:hypothetical protein